MSNLRFVWKIFQMQVFKYFITSVGQQIGRLRAYLSKSYRWLCYSELFIYEGFIFISSLLILACLVFSSVRCCVLVSYIRPFGCTLFLACSISRLSYLLHLTSSPSFVSTIATPLSLSATPSLTHHFLSLTTSFSVTSLLPVSCLCQPPDWCPRGYASQGRYRGGGNWATSY